MEVEWLTVLDRVEDFRLEEASLEKWNAWLKQFNILLRATAFGRLPNVQRVALLLTKCKGFISVLKGLRIDDENIEFDDLVSNLTQYLKPVNTRSLFFERRQDENESFEHFAEELMALSRPCRFLDGKILRDVFLFNMHEKHAEIKRLIKAKHDPTLEEAVALANAMLDQGCISDALQSHVMSPPRSTPFVTHASTPSVTNIRMMPCTVGVHEVQILHVSGNDDIVHVCPVVMLNTRKDWLVAMNVEMMKCKDTAVTPAVGNCYAAIVNSQWYRVRVLTVEERRKAKVLAYDFGWTKIIPFSVFRNMPLDYRVVESLSWAIGFPSVSKAVCSNTIVNLKITQFNNNWQAELVDGESQSPRSTLSGSEKDVTHRHGQTHQRLDKNGAARYGDKRDLGQPWKTQEGRSSFQCQRPLCIDETVQGRNDAKQQGLGAVLNSRGHGSSNSSVSSDMNHSIGNLKASDVDTSDRSRGRYSKHRSGKSARPRNVYQVETKAAGYPSNQHNGIGEKSIGQQQSTSPRSKPHDSSPAFKDSPFESKNKGPNGFVSRQRPATSAEKEVDEPVQPSQPAFLPLSVESELADCNTRVSNCPTRPYVEFANQPVHSLCPIPLKSFSLVRVKFKSQGDRVFCVRSDLENELEALCEEIQAFGDEQKIVTNPQEGDLCLAWDPHGALSRAKITKVFPSRLRAKIRFIDFGYEDKKKVEDLQELPEKFMGIPPYSFCIQVPSEHSVQDEDEIEVMPDIQNEDGVWTVKVRAHDARKTSSLRVNESAAAHRAPQSLSEPAARQHSEPPSPQPSRPAVSPQLLKHAAPAAAAAQPACETTVAQPTVKSLPKPLASQQIRQASSVRSRIVDPPRRPRQAPIPLNSFSKVVIVHFGREGIFALDKTKGEIFAEISRRISEITFKPLQGSPELHKLYVAPFRDDGKKYRGLVKEIFLDRQSCLVTFVDYGNEEEVPISDLQILPNELCGDINTFKVTLDQQSRPLEIYTELEVAPVVYQADGSWLVQCKGEPTTPSFALPDDQL